MTSTTPSVSQTVVTPLPAATSTTPSNTGEVFNHAIDFPALAERALPFVQEIINNLGLDGEQQGKEFVALNPNRADNELGSFKLNTETGKWSDFADANTAGGDLISYIAYVKGYKPTEAAQRLRVLLDQLEGAAPSPCISGNTASPAPTTRKVSGRLTWTPIVPVPVDAPARPPAPKNLGTPVGTWTYHDAQGNVIAYVDRFEKDGQKEYRPATYCTTSDGARAEWRIMNLPAPRPLNNLHLLPQRPEAPVLICEGEKAADAAAALFPNHVVTTTMNGAQAVDKADLSPLAGRDVTIWPDNDEPGEKYATTLINKLNAQSNKEPVNVLRLAKFEAATGENGQQVLRLRQEQLAVSGWDAADALAEGWTAELCATLPEGATEHIKADNSYTVGDYRVTDQGVVKLKMGEGDRIFQFPVCSRLDAIARSRDERNQNWGLMVRFADHDGVVKTWAIPDETLRTKFNEVRGTLANMGLRILCPGGQQDMLGGYLQALDPTGRVRCASKTGWMGEVFVLPHRVFGVSTEEVVFQTADPINGNAFSQAETLEAWKENVARYAQGNSRLALATLCGLAGPFMEKMGQDNGGIHFRGDSSVGKTTALTLAASIWGMADKSGFINTWRATGNGIEGLSKQRNGTVLILDELNQVSPSEAGATAYLLGNGQGKLRAMTTGAARTVATFNFMFLSTGEISLADHMASDGKRAMAGQEIRMLDIPADANHGFGIFENLHEFSAPAKLAEAINANVKLYFGTAGIALLEAVTAPGYWDAAKPRLEKDIATFRANYLPLGAEGQVIRAAHRFAYLAAIGEECVRLDILPWEEGEATKACRLLFNAWLESRGTDGALEDHRILEQVRLFLENHGESRFTNWTTGIGDDDNLGNSRTMSRVGFRRIEPHPVTGQDATHYYVTTRTFAKDVAIGFDKRKVVKVLTAAGCLRLSPKGEANPSVRLPGYGSTSRVYVILPTIFPTGNDEDEVIPDQQTQAQAAEMARVNALLGQAENVTSSQEAKYNL